MKPNKNHLAWQRLTEAARRAPASEESAAPYGFSTRVAAMAFESPAPMSVSALLDRFSLRALFAACALMVACLATSYSLTASSGTDELPLPQDPVAEILEVTS